MNHNTSKMNRDQSEAVMHLTGPCLVIAPPGSGKTFTLIERICYLTQEAGIGSDSILVITFTKAATKQMKERYLARIKSTDTTVCFGTIHALCFGILRTSFGYDAKALLSQVQKVHMLQEIIEEIEKKEIALWQKADLDRIDPEQVLEEISKMKNQGKQPEEYETSVMDAELFRTVATQYLLRCRCGRKLDFDDMVLKCLEELQRHTDILKIWQDKFRYLLVDEVQDIDRMQYRLITMLAKPQNNIFMVGDDDQSIYGFRGAEPSLMFSMEKDFPKLRKINLRYNYRSTAEIVNAASALISCNLLRFEKEIVSARGEGGRIRLAVVENTDEQNEVLIEWLKEFAKSGSIAMIARTNAKLSEYAGILAMNKIPFSCREKIKNPYENPIIRDVEAYFRLAIGKADRRDFIRIMNKPLRYLSRAAVSENITDWKESLHQYYADKKYMHGILDDLSRDLERIACFSPFAAVNYIRYGMGYEKSVAEEADANEREQIGEALELLMAYARKYDSHMDYLEAIRKAREAAKESANGEAADDEKKVILITMHGAKGLEYDHVLLPDLNERIIPHRKAFLPESMEEERRLLYVAMTRAKKSLFLSTVQDRKNQKKEISRFFNELVQLLKKRKIPFQMLEKKDTVR